MQPRLRKVKWVIRMPQERAVSSEQLPPSRRQNPAPAPPPAAKAESFSFQDLVKDLEPLPPAGGTGFQDLGGADELLTSPREFDDPRNDRAMGAHGLDEIPDPEIDKKLAQMLGEGREPTRMLTGSAAKGTPMWISGGFLGALSWGMCYTLALNPTYQPLGTYVSLVISAGGIAWGISGLRNEADSAGERKLCLVGLGLAASAAAVAALNHFAG